MFCTFNQESLWYEFRKMHYNSNTFIGFNVLFHFSICQMSPRCLYSLTLVTGVPLQKDEGGLD